MEKTVLFGEIFINLVSYKIYEEGQINLNKHHSYVFTKKNK